jgi:hypothetical protein
VRDRTPPLARLFGLVRYRLNVESLCCMFRSQFTIVVNRCRVVVARMYIYPQLKHDILVQLLTRMMHLDVSHTTTILSSLCPICPCFLVVRPFGFLCQSGKLWMMIFAQARRCGASCKDTSTGATVQQKFSGFYITIINHDTRPSFTIYTNKTKQNVTIPPRYHLPTSAAYDVLVAAWTVFHPPRVLAELVFQRLAVVT